MGVDGVKEDDFNPHSPCGERHKPPCFIQRHLAISIHTPHAGSDEMRAKLGDGEAIFQSTLPMRGATFDCL